MDGAVSVSTSKDPARIAGMFDEIAGRYDFLNHTLSVGLDKGWRRRAIRELALTGQERVVDICTGTGDLAIEAVTHPRGRAADVVGLDFSGEMLQGGLAKMRRLGLDSRVRLARADAMRLPLADASCDVATVAFGIRNVADAVRRLPRVVARAAARRPVRDSRVWHPDRARRPAGLPLVFLASVLPRIGRLVSRHGDAYSVSARRRSTSFQLRRSLPAAWRRPASVGAHRPSGLRRRLSLCS